MEGILRAQEVQRSGAAGRVLSQWVIRSQAREHFPSPRFFARAFPPPLSPPLPTPNPSQNPTQELRRAELASQAPK